jgi:ABC-type lipoprotein export system ATPase subunit
VGSLGAPVIVRDISVEHVRRGGVIRALATTDLEVDGGSSVAIMGPSGCGKSTLLGVMAGLAVPTTGTVTIGGQPISAMTEHERLCFRRTSLGMVYQADNLLPHLTVEENVGLQRSISGRTADRGQAAVGEVLERLGIAHLAGRLPDHLSGGQRQRAAVARAIVHRPSVILADEPTGALDPTSAHAVIELLVEVHRQIGATLIVVTHDPSIGACLMGIVHLEAPMPTRPEPRSGPDRTAPDRRDRRDRRA